MLAADTVFHFLTPEYILQISIGYQRPLLLIWINFHNMNK